MANDIWINNFPSATVDFLPPDFSNHSAGILKIASLQKGSLASNSSIFWQDRVHDHWSSCSVYETYMYQLCTKLTALKGPLRTLSYLSYVGIHQRVSICWEELLQLQQEVLFRPIEESILAVHSKETELIDLQVIEEAFLRQKSRVKWLKEEDQNTTYFHRMVTGHIARQRISCLSCDDGSFTTNADIIKSEIIKFYKNLLGTADPSFSDCDVNYLRGLLLLKLLWC